MSLVKLFQITTPALLSDSHETGHKYAQLHKPVEQIFLFFFNFWQILKFYIWTLALQQ